MRSISVLSTAALLLVTAGFRVQAEDFSVSLVQLIARADTFIGQRVSVMGYIQNNSGPKLYLNHISASIFDIASSIHVIDPSKDGTMPDQCNKRYVTISEKIIKDEGAIKISEVDSVIDAKTLSPCWIKK